MSSLKDLASLIMIPSLYEDGKLHTVKPLADENIIVHPDATDNNDGVDGSTPSTSSNFTFSRGSNLAATRVDVNGLIEKGRENLLLQSNQFDTTWTTSAASVTSGQSGYDGSSDAWLLTATNTFNRVQQSISVSGVKRFSVYAKANTNDYLLLGSFEGAHYYATFNLATGAVDSNNANVKAASIEDVGNGWYRCSATWVSTTTQVRIGTQNSNGQGAWATTTSGSIYIQDAQLEKGLVATDYIETGASTAQAGILEDMPRLDYSGGASCPSLLLEPQRTNDWAYSEYVSGNPLVSSPIITKNYAVSPEGLSNAFRIQDTTGGSFKRISISSSGLSVSVNSTYTQSLFVKKATSAITNYGGIGFDYTGGTTRKIAYVVFDEYNGTLAELTSGFPLNTTLHPVEDYGDYWRFSVSTTDNGSNTNLSMNIYACLSTNGTTAGTGTKDWTGYGLQLEAGSYPTSYIPTMGASVTRSGDAASVTGVADLLGDEGGTLFVEVEHFEDNAHIVLSDGTLANNFPFRFRGLNFQNDMKVNNVSQGNIVVSPITTNTKYKVASRYSLNDRAVYFDGVLKDVDYTANVFPSGTLTRIAFDRGDNAAHFYGRIYQIAVFPTALTNAELAALTS